MNADFVQKRSLGVIFVRLTLGDVYVVVIPLFECLTVAASLAEMLFLVVPYVHQNITDVWHVTLDMCYIILLRVFLVQKGLQIAFSVRR